MKHTPGPWKVFRTTDGRKILGIGEASTAEGITDCGFGLWRHGDQEHEANAKLIAAAPELLAALVALRAVVAASPTMQGREYVDLGIKVNAAIAKATAQP